MGKKRIIFVTYENNRISMRKSLPYKKGVLHLSCVVHGPIQGHPTSIFGKYLFGGRFEI